MARPALRRRERGMKTLGLVLALAALAVAWLLFAPLELGGHAGYVIVAGDSMEPGLSSGDLVVIRAAGRTEVGDVVSYDNPELGAVIHRVVGVDGERFTVQGDNNDWTDSYQPAQRDIAGQLWFTIPGAGRYLGYVQQPAILTLLAIVTGLTIMLPGRKKPTKQPPAAASGWPTLRNQQGRDLAGLLAVVGVAALIVAGLAFSRPVERETVREAPYNHSGAFSYAADAPGGVYDGGELVTGDPIFRNLIDSFDISFDYELTSSAPIDSAGDATLVAVLESSNGWTRTFELQPETAFDGTTATLAGTVDLVEIQRAITRLEADTGIVARNYTLTIQPDLSIAATIGGQSVEETFAPGLAFQLDAQQLQLTGASASEENALAPGAGGLVTQLRQEPSTIPLGPFEPAVATARTVSSAILGLVALGMIALVALSLRTPRGTGAELIAAQHAGRIVSVRPNVAIEAGGVVEVSSHADFARLLDHHAGPIFHTGSAYYIDSGGQRFRYGAAPAHSNEDESDSGEPLAPEISTPTAAAQAQPRRQFALGSFLFRQRRRMERA